MTSARTHDFDETARLRAEWLSQRSRLLDPDTGLPTLAGMMDDLRRVLESGSALHVFAIRLSADRDYEQMWGWQTYDRLVAEFIQRLREALGARSIPGGMLGLMNVRSDEILVFSPAGPDAGSGDETESHRRRHAEALEGFVRDYIAEHAPATDISASFTGSSTIVFDSRLRVERQIYRGLREARDEIERRLSHARTKSTESLREIISEGRIRPVFQPILDLSSREVLAFEALSRGPAGSGFDDGETLFDAAEQADLLQPLERACRRRIFEAARRLSPGRELFLNVSPSAAFDSEFVDGSFEGLVRSSGLTPDRVVIEITERTYALHQERFLDVLRELRRRGFRLAVDDMGTGYSSLSSLAEIDPDFLKFDGVFVHEIHRHRIKRDLLDAMLAFARKSETRVIAEGIETAEELATLLELGVPLGQGFFFARPAPLPGGD